MKLQRIAALLRRELLLGPRNAMLLFAVVIPLTVSLAVQLLFGNAFSGLPRLGLVAADAAQILAATTAFDGITTQRFTDEAALRAATERGSIDIGLIVPATFDERVARGEAIELTAYVWGESLLRNRALISTALANWFREAAGQRDAVALTTIQLGNGQSWQERLLPTLLLMCVGFGAVVLPASSVVLEKTRRTLYALTVTPVATGEFFIAKGALGVLVSVVMALIVLLINNALNTAIAPVGVVLILGAVFCAQLGVLIGALVKDLEALFGIYKSLALLLYAPAIVAFFPQIPSWIAMIFPTYYVVNPVVELAQNGATAADIMPQLAVLLLEIALMVPLLSLAGRRMRENG